MPAEDDSIHPFHVGFPEAELYQAPRSFPFTAPVIAQPPQMKSLFRTRGGGCGARLSPISGDALVPAVA